LARLPSPRHAMYRGLRIPDLRKGDDSPLAPRSIALFQTPALPKGHRPSHDVLAAPLQQCSAEVYDAVRLIASRSWDSWQCRPQGRGG
jgi:hypothetical protein